MADERDEWVTLDAAGEVRIPTIELLTGRGFVTGKSGGGKSNTASVVAEELLADGHPLLIVDTDGEYYGLKERYEVLHAGTGEECDVRVGTEHADKLAELALDAGVPVILDVSASLEGGHDLVEATVEALFQREQEARRPFLLLVEEVHEFIPESGGLSGAGRMLIRVAKRGRKRGLGFCGISQRPANVKKDVITQCDWLCWHRLTWDNDTKLVRRVIDGAAAETVQNLADGEAILVTDWDGERRRVQIRRKETFDAGATPGLGDVDRPELKSIGDGLLGDLEDISDRSRARSDRLARLEAQLERKNERIADLEAELSRAQDLRDMAAQFTTALTDAPTETDRTGAASVAETELPESTDEASDAPPAAERDADPADGDSTDGDPTPTADTSGAEGSRESVPTPDESGIIDASAAREPPAEDSYAALLDAAVVEEVVRRADAHSRASPAYAKGIVATLLDEDGPVRHRTLLTRLASSSTDDLSTVATTLESMRVVEKRHTDEGLVVALDETGVRELREATVGRERTRKLADEF